MLEAIELTKRFGDTTLFDNASLRLTRGENSVLFGASGAGKSTLIRILAGLEEPDGGTVRLDGTDRREIPPRNWRRRVILVHQEPRMFPGSVTENITLAADKHDIDVNPGEILENLQLDLDPDSPAKNLSGGERKRVALGRALALNPDFLLLDEPTASLDESARETIDDLILSAIHNGNRGVLIVTHNPREVAKFGTTGYLLRNGTLEDLKPNHLENPEATL